MKLTKADFDNATSGPWTTSTCVIAQMFKRELNAELHPAGCSSITHMTLSGGREVPIDG